MKLRAALLPEGGTVLFASTDRTLKLWGSLRLRAQVCRTQCP